MRSFRNSRLSLRRECGHAYMKAYIEGDPGVPAKPLRGGQNVHAAVAEVIRALMTSGMVDIHRIAHRTVVGADADYADALEVLAVIQETIDEWDLRPDQILWLEERVTMPVTLSTGETVEFFGTPDLVERVGRRKIRITDHKTHWRPETEGEFREGQQLKRYALLTHYQLDGAPEEYELVKRFVRYENNVYRETLTAADLHQVRMRLVSEIEETIAMDDAGNFEATPGSWCGLCAYHASCPVILRARADGIGEDLSITDDERAAELAGDAVAMTAAATELKNRVKAYLGADHAKGEVPLAGGAFGFGPVDHREVDPAELRKVLEEFKVEPWEDLFRVDLKVFDRFVRRLPEDVAAALNARAVRRWQGAECRFRRTPARRITATAPNGASAGDTEDLFS